MLMMVDDVEDMELAKAEATDSDCIAFAPVFVVDENDSVGFVEVEAVPVHVVKEEGTLEKDIDDGDGGDMDMVV